LRHSPDDVRASGGRSLAPVMLAGITVPPNATAALSALVRAVGAGDLADRLDRAGMRRSTGLPSRSPKRPSSRATPTRRWLREPLRTNEAPGAGPRLSAAIRA